MGSHLNRRSVVLSALSAGLLTACQEDGKIRPGGYVKGRSSDPIGPITHTDREAFNYARLERLSFEQRQNLLRAFSVNLDYWWAGQPYKERLEKAYQAGFSSLEFKVDPVAKTALGGALKPVARLCQSVGLKVSKIDVDMPPLVDQAKQDVFKHASFEAITSAQILNVDRVGFSAQKSIAAVSQAEALKLFQDRLSQSHDLWAQAKIYALITPFNSQNDPNALFYDPKDMLELYRVLEQDLGPHIYKINWDVLNMHTVKTGHEADLNLAIDYIEYIQLADNPDRTQPGTGGLDYNEIIRQARGSGYDGPMGLTCKPQYNDIRRAVIDVLYLAQTI